MSQFDGRNCEKSGQANKLHVLLIQGGGVRASHLILDATNLLIQGTCMLMWYFILCYKNSSLNWNSVRKLITLRAYLIPLFNPRGIMSVCVCWRPPLWRHYPAAVSLLWQNTKSTVKQIKLMERNGGNSRTQLN